ncbi:MAG TPA: YbhN family protein [Acidimicrobiales bacterium]|nr:YbhN family protein [Acidimicrobiales bacterium]
MTHQPGASGGGRDPAPAGENEAPGPASTTGPGAAPEDTGAARGGTGQGRIPWWRPDRRLHQRHRTFLKKSLRRGVALFVVALVIEYLVLPQLAGANRDLTLIGGINLGYAALGVVLEAAALVAYAALTRAVLPRGSPPLFQLLRIDLSSLAASHVLPGGTAGGTGVSYRLLTEAGVRGPDAAFGMATQGLGSALVLNLLLWLALLVSIPLRGFNPLYGTAAFIGVVVFAAFGALVFLLTRGEEHAATVLQAVAHRLPYVKEEVVTATVRRLASRLRELASDRRLLLRAVGWATANWLLDAASLWVFLLAFHHATSPDVLLVTFGLANVLASIPITPGGLGVVEGVMIPMLVGFGTPRGIAILGVISYRLVNFWLPIPVGALAYLSMRVVPDRMRPGRDRGAGPDGAARGPEPPADGVDERAGLPTGDDGPAGSQGDQDPSATAARGRGGHVTR